MEKSGENEQKLSEKISKIRRFFILNTGGNPVLKP